MSVKVVKAFFFAFKFANKLSLTVHANNLSIESFFLNTQTIEQLHLDCDAIIDLQ